MDKLKEIIEDIVTGHCNGGYIESTTDFINDLTNAVKNSNQVERVVSLGDSSAGAKSELTFGGWIDINEKMPDYDGEYLVKVFTIAMQPETKIKILFGRKYTVVRGNNKYHNFGWHGLHSELKVTHWMPLPKP